MNQGVIKVADHNGVFVIKMEGDVRLTLCISFDSFIDQMFGQQDFCSVVFDLTEAQAIDSTTLGLMAKISILGSKLNHADPIVLSTNDSITRLLVSMGFEDIFRLVDTIDVDSTDVDMSTIQPLPPADGDENFVKLKVLEAHRVLMDMNEKNKDTFTELVTRLEDE